MTLFRVVIDCQHPLCSRGMDSQRRARVQVVSAPAPDHAAFAAARALCPDARSRRCLSCHRPAAIDKITLIELDADLFEVQKYSAPDRPVWRDMSATAEAASFKR